MNSKLNGGGAGAVSEELWSRRDNAGYPSARNVAPMAVSIAIDQDLPFASHSRQSGADVAQQHRLPDRAVPQQPQNVRQWRRWGILLQPVLQQRDASVPQGDKTTFTTTTATTATASAAPITMNAAAVASTANRTAAHLIHAGLNVADRLALHSPLEARGHRRTAARVVLGPSRSLRTSGRSDSRKREMVV